MIQNSPFILTGSHDKIILGDYTYDDNHTNREVIIFVHGFKGFKDWGAHHLIAQFFAEKGCRFLKFNLSHNGVTQENLHDVTDMAAFSNNTISYELADLTTVINYVAHTFPLSKITLIGHSRGGGLAIIKATTDPRISRIVTWSAIADFSSLWKPEQEVEWKKTGRIYVENARTKEKMPLSSTLLTDYQNHKTEYHILSAAQNINIPWLIIQGDEDVNVPQSVAEKLLKAQPAARLKIINGANHVFGASHPYPQPQLPAHLQEACENTYNFIMKNESQ